MELICHPSSMENEYDETTYKLKVGLSIRNDLLGVATSQDYLP